jgi:hypothetical protein
MGEGGIKDKDEGGGFNCDIFIIRTFVNITMYHQFNNNFKK